MQKVLNIKRDESNKIEPIYNDVYDLTIQDNASPFEHMSKLAEEVGEFAQCVNKLCGRKGKKGDFNEEELKENFLEEAVDCIQVIFSLMAKFGIKDLDEFYKKFNDKNIQYKKFINNKKLVNG